MNTFLKTTAVFTAGLVTGICGQYTWQNVTLSPEAWAFMGGAGVMLAVLLFINWMVVVNE